MTIRVALVVALFCVALSGCSARRALPGDDMRKCYAIEDRGGLGVITCKDPARDFDR